MDKDNDRKRESTGEYSETFPLAAFLDALDSEGPRATTTEITERVGCSPDTARSKLETLASEDRVTRRKFGQTYVWSLSDDE